MRSYKDLIHKLTMPQEFRFPDSEERFTCRMLTVSGKGKRKTIRLHKSALPLLKCWDEDAYENYMAEFDEHTFSGNARHVERNHLVAETAVMCMKDGIEANPLYTPEVMDDEVRRLRLTDPCFYFARELKRVNDYELNKIRFTRLAGAIVYPGGAYAVYNYREIKETKGLDNGLFKTYKNIFFVSMDEFGAQLLRVLTTPDWKERILRGLFADEDRSYDRGSFTYDSYANGVFELSFLDGDISRLFRFCEAILNRSGIFRIICYPEQKAFLQAYFGDMAELSTVKMDDVEELLEINVTSLI